LEVGKDRQTYSREEVMNEARQKYPNLDFK
jgi:hypothetical protein